MDASARERFAALAERARGGGTVDLCEAALVVAAEDSAGLVIDETRREIEALARAARATAPADAAPEERLRALNEFFFRELGFHGNRDAYYDPRNSFLNEVVARRTGIPITLSILYCELAAAVGLEARGVGFPGHFLVRVERPEEPTPWMVDAFSAQLLDRDGCEGLLRHFLGPSATLDDQALAPARPLDVLVRLLSNLKTLYLQAEDFERMLACSERLLLLLPDAPLELRDRGLVLHRLECPAQALDDLERFLALAPAHGSAPAIRQLVAELTARRPALH